MTSRPKRLAFTLAAIGLGAVLIGSAIAREALAAPKKPKAKRTFVIQVNHYFGIWGDWATWEGTGAIEGSGNAFFSEEPDLELLSKRGAIDLQLHEDNTFTIVGGTRKFSELSGGGSFTKEHFYYWPDGVPEYPPEDPPNGGLIAEDIYLLEGALQG